LKTGCRTIPSSAISAGSLPPPALRECRHGLRREQVAGKPFDAEKHARLAGSLARLLDSLGLTVCPGVSSASASPPFDAGKCLRENAAKLAQEKAISEGWSDTERDRYAEELWQESLAGLATIAIYWASIPPGAARTTKSSLEQRSIAIVANNLFISTLVLFPPSA
jgi:hypothetical protein